MTYFKIPENIVAWDNIYSNYFKSLDSMPASMIGSRLSPKDVFNRYCGYRSDLINNFLRGSLPSDCNDYIKKETEVISIELRKFPLKESIVVVRRLPNKLIAKNTKKGSIIKDRGFLSTSLYLFFQKKKDSNDILPFKNQAVLFIKVPQNTHAIYVEPLSDREEYELLLPSGMKILIEEKYRIFSNRIFFCKIVN